MTNKKIKEVLVLESPRDTSIAGLPCQLAYYPQR
jgi:hypothetical protein